MRDGGGGQIHVVEGYQMLFFLATSTSVWDSKLSKPAVLIMTDGDTFDIGKQLTHFNDYFCLSLRSTPLRCQEQNQTKV